MSGQFFQGMMQMRFKFNNVYDPGIGYEYETDLTLQVCPKSCSSKWTKDYETFEFSAISSINIDVSSEGTKCAFTSLTEKGNVKYFSQIRLPNA